MCGLEHRRHPGAGPRIFPHRSARRDRAYRAVRVGRRPRPLRAEFPARPAPRAARHTLREAAWSLVFLGSRLGASFWIGTRFSAGINSRLNTRFHTGLNARFGTRSNFNLGFLHGALPLMSRSRLVPRSQVIDLFLLLNVLRISASECLFGHSHRWNVRNLALLRRQPHRAQLTFLHWLKHLGELMLI